MACSSVRSANSASPVSKVVEVDGAGVEAHQYLVAGFGFDVSVDAKR